MRLSASILLCAFALLIAPLSAAHGPMQAHMNGHADHGGYSAANGGHGVHTEMPKAEADHLDSKTGMEQCEMMPGHCTIIALSQDLASRPVHYGSAGLVIAFDEQMTGKYRPDTELRPPKV